jgi:hypothetical protein
MNIESEEDDGKRMYSSSANEVYDDIKLER